MTSRARILVGVLGVLVVLLIAAFLFVRYQIRKSFPQESGSLRVAGLQEPVDIARDEYGVPSIVARNAHDLMFAEGFVHAQDRLWQMDMERRAGEGRLSEIIGKETLPFDRMLRTVGIRRIAEAIERSLPEGTAERLQWYADGVNAYIDTHRGKYPVEFDLLRYEPEPWLPLHSLIIGRLLAWELNMSWWADLTIGAIAEKVGLEKSLDIFPPYPGTVAPIVSEKDWRKYAGLGREFLHTSHELAAFLGFSGVAGGSNAWVIGPAHSASGNVILANDTHLQLRIPSQWYELQLRVPGWMVHGMSVPGAPGVVAGRNDSIAWGVTNVMADDADFYIEQIDSATGTSYFYDGRWLPVNETREEIAVRGDSAQEVVIRSTHHGPIVTGVRAPLLHAGYRYEASMRWTGDGLDDQFGAFFAIDTAKTWSEFLEGVRKFAVPGQNFVYGDVQGNIGYWCGVKLPMRGKLNPLLPLPGWTKDAEWKGFVPFEKLPHLFNPPEGYIATANNKVVDDSYPYYISDLWEPPSRILRLREVLGRPGLFSVADFNALQNDKFSYSALEIVPYIFAAFADSDAGKQDTSLFTYFRNWNYMFSQNDLATALYQEFLVRLLDNIYRDEMGDDLFHDFVILTNIPLRVTTTLLQQGSSPWFDDVRTEAVETRDMIVRKSYIEAVAELRRRLGDDTKTWRWGTLHTITFQHPFGLRRPLDKLFDIGPFPYPGASTALISGEYSFNAPFDVDIGASYRQIFDLGDPQQVHSVLPPGESGQVMSPHYGDQVPLWLAGGLRNAGLEETGGNLRRLRLEPQK